MPPRVFPGRGTSDTNVGIPGVGASSRPYLLPKPPWEGETHRVNCSETEADTRRCLVCIYLFVNKPFVLVSFGVCVSRPPPSRVLPSVPPPGTHTVRPRLAQTPAGITCTSPHILVKVLVRVRKANMGLLRGSLSSSAWKHRPGAPSSSTPILVHGYLWVSLGGAG